MSSSMSAGGHSSSSSNRRRGVFSLGRYRLGSSPGPGAAPGLAPADAKAVKYTPRGAPYAGQGSSTSSLLHHGHGGSHDDDLEEIAVVSVSGVQSGQLTYGSSGASITNGPRVVPGRSLSLFNTRPIVRFDRPGSSSRSTLGSSSDPDRSIRSGRIDAEAASDSHSGRVPASFPLYLGPGRRDSNVDVLRRPYK